MARRFASWLPFYEYGEGGFFGVDSAPPEVIVARRGGFMRLAALFAERFKNAVAQTSALAGSVSDLEFTSRYRGPFQFSGYVRRHLTSGSFVQSSCGVTVTDLDGNRSYDLTGSYGVNVFGYDFYKDCIERGAERVRDLGPVLGAYHPVGRIARPQSRPGGVPRACAQIGMDISSREFENNLVPVRDCAGGISTRFSRS